MSSNFSQFVVQSKSKFASKSDPDPNPCTLTTLLQMTNVFSDIISMIKINYFRLAWHMTIHNELSKRGDEKEKGWKCKMQSTLMTPAI